MKKENNIVDYQSTIADIRQIIVSGQKYAYNAVSEAMVFTYWQVGRRIIEQEQKGKERAEYGKALIEVLSKELTKEFGKSYSKRNLQYFRKFYLFFPDKEIVNACVHNLNWTHFRSLLRVANEDARIWYMNEAANEGWSTIQKGKRCVYQIKGCTNMMGMDEEITDEMVWDINREKVMRAPERIRIVTQYILEHFDQKTYRGDKTPQPVTKIISRHYICIRAEALQKPEQ